MGAAILTGNGAVADLANIGASALVQGYGREAEMEADRIGMKYLVKCRLRPDRDGPRVPDLQGAGDPSRWPARARKAASRGCTTACFPRTRRPTTAPCRPRGSPPQITDVPEGGYVVNRNVYMQAIDGLAFGIQPRPGRRAGQSLLSCGHGHHPGLPARLDHREPTRKPAGLHRQQGKRHADLGGGPARRQVAARVPDRETQGRVPGWRRVRSPSTAWKATPC